MKVPLGEFVDVQLTGAVDHNQAADAERFEAVERLELFEWLVAAPGLVAMTGVAAPVVAMPIDACPGLSWLAGRDGDTRDGGGRLARDTGRVGENRLAIGRRVVVTGLAGSGKSTLAVALADKTGLPLIHLDLAFWKPGWVAPSETEWREKQRVVLAGDAWIADGNYHETLDLRIERADTLVVLDMSWWLCSARALRRGFRMPGELPEGCDYSAWARWRDEWRLAGRIWRKRYVEPAHEREVISRYAHDVAVHVLRSKSAVNDFLDEVRVDRGISYDG